MSIQMSKIDTIMKLLEELEDRVSDIIGTAVIRTNGLVVASALPSESNERMIAAMSAALLGTSKRSAENLFEATFKSLNLELDKGNMFLIEAGRVILVSITKKEPNVGLITLEMEDVSKKLRELFKIEE
jgi:hypothetical protein